MSSTSSSFSSSATATNFVLLNWLIEFMNDSYKLLNRCTKPDRKEYIKIATAVLIGFLIMGFIGYFVKLIHIPINNIIVGGRS